MRDAEVNALFVYGTLRPGERRHGMLKNVCRILAAQAPGILLDCGEYPAMRLLSAGETGLVAGEWIEVDSLAEQLPALDEEEGYYGPGQPGSLFRRELIEVQLENGEVRAAWIYLGEAALAGSLRVIAGGDWKAHRAQAPG